MFVDEFSRRFDYEGRAKLHRAFTQFLLSMTIAKRFERSHQRTWRKKFQGGGGLERRCLRRLRVLVKKHHEVDSLGLHKIFCVASVSSADGHDCGVLLCGFIFNAAQLRSVCSTVQSAKVS